MITPLSPDPLQHILSCLDHERQKIIFTNGVFDLLHAAHLTFLQQAKALGDILIVAVDTDRAVKRFKGERRPIIPEMERLRLIQSLIMVDYAFLFEGGEVLPDLIRQLRPHLYVKGNDYVGTSPACAEVLREVGTTWCTLPLAPGQDTRTSTSGIIYRIVEWYASP